MPRPATLNPFALTSFILLLQEKRKLLLDLLATFDEMWFLTTGPMVIVPSDLKSNSLTYTVDSSSVSTLPLAVSTVVDFLLRLFRFPARQI